MDIKRYRQATIAGTKWLLSQQNEDGSFRPVRLGVATFHKVLMALAVMGQVERAARLCSWIQANCLDEEGDIGGHFPRTPLHQSHYLLANSWVVCGAHRLGQFGISIPAASFLATLQHPETGGFFSIGPSAGFDDEQDALTTATVGLAMLHTGNLEAAASAAEFLIWLLDEQPAGADTHLFYAVRNGQTLITTIPDAMLKMYLVDATKPEQWYHVPAMAAGFLGLMYEATGERKYLDAAQAYMTFIAGCSDDRYSSERSAFVGWAAAVLYTATGSTSYAQTTEEVGNNLLEMQLSNGSWLMLSMGENEESDVVDATAEALIVLTQILQAFATAI